MASDQVYHHQVDVDDAAYSESSESVESSDMEQHAPQTEVIEDATAAGGWQASPPPRLRQQQVAAASSDDAQPPPPRQRAPSVRAIKNLEVEVNGPTEDFLFMEGSLLTPYARGATAFNPLKSFCRLSDMVFYVYSKAGSTHPRKFIDCENLRDIKPGSLADFEFRLIDKNNREHKMRALSKEDYGAWVKAFQAALARRQRAANKAIKVWFMDISKVGIVIERGVTTAEDLWWLVCEALNLSDDSRDAFCIWLMGADLQVQLCNDDIITTVLEDWHTNYEAKFSHKLEGPPRLVFRTAPTLTLSAERNMKDPKAVHLFYLQAAYNVLYQNYVIPEDMAVALAGLMAQIRLADFDPAKHRPGYIGNNLRRYLPAYIMNRHKRTNTKWELDIQREHASHRGKTLLICEMLYLQQCRIIPYYGSIFFPSKNRDKARESGYWSQQTDGTINIGINMEGLHICRDLKYLHSYAWQNILHWESEQEKYFYFSGHANKPGKGIHKRVHTYLCETRSAPLIKEHIQDVIFEIKRQERVISKIRATQTRKTGTVQPPAP